MVDGIRLGKLTLALLDRMVARGLVMVRQTADTATALKQGGYVYFTHPDGKPVRADPARQLIRLGLLVSRKDDLFAGADGGGQTYAVADRLPLIIRPKPRKRRKLLK